jgi:hypothetical protein
VDYDEYGYNQQVKNEPEDRKPRIDQGDYGYDDY